MKKERGIALVSGGAKGIGAACCRALASRGFKVAIHYNSSASAAEDLSSQLERSFCIKADLSEIESVEEVYARIKEAGGNLEVLVNNAGIAKDAPIFSASLEDFDMTINTNIRAAWYLTKRLCRFMIRNKKGRVINISSVIAHTGNPTQSVYGLTKAALENFTKTAALELSHYGILVNSVAPGFIMTDMTDKITPQLKEKILDRIPLGRFGSAEEVAEIVSFLAESGAYCSGATFHVNGGMFCG